MQQSLFVDAAAEDPVVAAVHAAEARFRGTALAAVAVAGVSLVAAIAALAVAALR
jgi:hypothetical protein